MKKRLMEQIRRWMLKTMLKPGANKLASDDFNIELRARIKRTLEILVTTMGRTLIVLSKSDIPANIQDQTFTPREFADLFIDMWQVEDWTFEHRWEGRLCNVLKRLEDLVKCVEVELEKNDGSVPGREVGEVLE